jgi:hypothetical protein
LGLRQSGLDAQPLQLLKKDLVFGSVNRFAHGCRLQGAACQAISAFKISDFQISSLRALTRGLEMRLIWELLRTLWAVGCIPVGALLLVVMVLCGFNLAFFLGISGGADPVVRWLFWTLVMYFVGGGWLLLWVDQRYAGKLKQLAAEFKLQGFQPQFEVFAKMSDAYLGIDGPSRRLLAYPVDGAEHFLPAR